MVTEEIRNIVIRFVAVVEARGVHVDKALVYGSMASGRQTPDSDLDVAIVSSDFGKDRYSEGTMLNQLAWRIDSRLHPVPIATESYEHDTWIPLVHEIREHGIPVGPH